MNHGRGAATVQALLVTALCYNAMQKADIELKKIKCINGTDPTSLGTTSQPKVDAWSSAPALKEKLVQLRNTAFKVNLHMIDDEAKLVKKSVMLTDDDISEIANDLWTFVLTNYQTDSTLEAAHAAGKPVLTQVAAQKIKNWFSQSGSGGFQKLMKERKEQLRKQATADLNL